MSFQKIKLVTFDATNTLLKFRVPPWEHYTFVARNHGFKGTVTEVKTRFLNSYKDMWDKYPNFGKNKIAWEEWWRTVVRYTFEGQVPLHVNIDNIANVLIQDYTTSKCWCMADGVDKVVRYIRTKSIITGIISNFDPRLHEILRNINIHDKFDFIITSYDIGYSEPDERIFQYALKQCQKSIISSECLHVGDDVKKDYKAARAAGWHAVLINDKIKTEKSPASEHVFKNLIKLSKALEFNQLEL